MFQTARLLTRCAIGAVFVALAAVATASATTVVVPTDAQLFAASRAVVRGRVTEIRARRVDAGRRIVTYVSLDVDTVFAGDVAPGRLALREMGGQVGDDFSQVYGTPEFAVGERVLLYLNTDDEGVWHTAFMFVGKFSIVDNGGRDAVVRQRAGEGVLALQAPGKDATTEVADYDDYVAALRARAATAKRAAPTTPAQAVPAAFLVPAHQGDEQYHTNFTLLAGHPRWFEADEGQQIPYYFKPTPVLIDRGEGAVRDALAAWSTVPGCSLRLELVDETELCGYARDGQNTISFDDCLGQIDNGPCFGVIAIGGASGRANEHKTINGVDFVRTTDADVVFNDRQEGCLIARRLTFREILTHELGHTIGLGHSSEVGPEQNPRLKEATMYYALHDDGRAASLKPDDVDAVTFVYPISEVPPRVETESLEAANAGSPYEAALAVFGGEAPLTWSLTSGELPPGLMLSTAGALTGTPSAKGTATFTVTVEDARGRTASRELSLDVAGPKPVVSSASLRAARGKLVVTATVSDRASVEIWINGVRIAPPLRIKAKPRGDATKITIKGTVEQLNATKPAGSNMLVVVSDGAASAPFAF